MADSPSLNATGPIGIEIKSDGTRLPDQIPVLEVRVLREVNRIPEAVVVIEDGSVAAGEFPETDGKRFKPGAEISISAYYGDGEPETLFEGVVVAERLRLSGARPPRLQVTCRDKAVRMARTRSTAFFTKNKDSDIAKALIGDAGLTADVAATRGEARDQIQAGASDWDFVRAIADRNGLLVTVEAGKVTLKAPETSAEPVLSLTLGLDLIAFDAEVSSMSAVDEVVMLTWDPSSQSETETSTKPALSQTWGDLTATDLLKATNTPKRRLDGLVAAWSGEIGDFAKARADRSVLAGIQGTCTIPGSGKAVPGALVEIKEVGTRFGGKAFVSAVRHLIEAGSWQTEVGLGLPDEWLSDAPGLGGPPAAGLTAPIGGLQVAKVVQIHEDPDQRPRIKVKFPTLGSTATDVWARFMQPYAGNGAGLMFLPEIDDEVVVAFFADDPNDPVILGALHSAKLPRPAEAGEKNTLKTITTREKLKLTFDDDKKIVTLETPGGNRLVVDDDAQSITLEDQHGDRIEMSSAGIALDSAADIVLKAAGSVTVEAGSDVKVSGSNVSCEGQMAFKAQGGSSADLQASGTVTIAGSLVKIN